MDLQIKVRGPETERSHQYRIDTGFYDWFMKGTGLDIGYKGSTQNACPVLESAIGIDFDTPNYDGVNLPFQTGSHDYVFTSHVLEHIPTEVLVRTLREWFRVLKIGGYLILNVPHKFLYERKAMLPSSWNRDHKRFYTPSSLCTEIELAFNPNSYRIRLLRDNDRLYDYDVPLHKHPNGCYEIECVIQKISPPNWEIE